MIICTLSIWKYSRYETNFGPLVDYRPHLRDKNVAMHCLVQKLLNFKFKFKYITWKAWSSFNVLISNIYCHCSSPCTDVIICWQLAGWGTSWQRGEHTPWEEQQSTCSEGISTVRGGRGWWHPPIRGEACHHVICACLSVYGCCCGHHQLRHFLHREGRLPVSLSQDFEFFISIKHASQIL